MEWSTVTLILGILGILTVAVIGGTVVFKKDGSITLDTRGFLEWVNKASTAKGIAPSASRRRVSQEVAEADIGRGTLPRATILWVDDHPINNLYEKRALATLGIFCDAYTVNSEAIEALRSSHFDVIVSDVGRDTGGEDGWDLLAKVRECDAAIPFIFYTSGVDKDAMNKAVERGADGITESPNDLMSMIVRNLARAV